MNLPRTKAPELSAEDVRQITSDADAIFYSHYHGDHIGLCGKVPGYIPQYIGEGAKEVHLIRCQALAQSSYDKIALHREEYERTLEAVKAMKTYQPNHRIDVAGKGKIYVTPYFVDHSAFDAYMFLLEVEGRRVLYTGDFRTTGFLGKGLEPVLKNYVRKVDILITEGTLLNREREPVSETALEHKTAQLLSQESPVHFMVLCSSTDMDCLAVFHAACRTAHITMICDGYQKRILDVFTKYAGVHTPLFNFNDATTYALSDQKSLAYFRADRFLMVIRASQTDIVRQVLSRFPDTRLIYSMWRGYCEGTEEQRQKSIMECVHLFGDHVCYLHTSGHADIETLQKVCCITQPSLGVIPIHKEPASRFEDLLMVKPFHVITKSEQIGNVKIVML